MRIPLQRPRRVQHFQGRESEIAGVLEALQPGRVVTLVGPGGMGKSAIAAQVVWQLAPADEPPETFPDGIVFHTFYDRPQADAALEHLAASYGVSEQGRPQDVARRALAGKRALVVLDGAEEADDLRAVLDVCGSCGVLVSSRRRQDAPDAMVEVGVLPPDKAVDLLQAWAGAMAADEAAAAEICALAGYLPLAVTVAGQYMREQKEPAEEYLDWLQSTPLAALDHGDRRERSVPLLLDRSLVQVSETARRAQAVAGILALAPFPRDLLAAALDMEPDATRGPLGELVDYGLLQRVEEGWQVSHVLVLTYAARRQPASDELLQHLVDYFGDIWRGSAQDNDEGRARMPALRPHVMAVLEALQAQAMWDEVSALSWTVQGYLDMLGFWTDRLLVANAALAAARALPDEAEEAKWLGTLGIVYVDQGDWQRAIEMQEQSLEVFERLGDMRGMAQAYGNLGIVYHHQGQWARAVEMHKKDLKISKQLGDTYSMAQTYNNLGLVYTDQGRWAQAVEMYEKDLEIGEQLGDIYGMAQTYNNLGLVYVGQGQWKRAVEMYERSLELKKSLGDVHGMSQTYNNLGVVYHKHGHQARAVEMYEKDLEISERLGDNHSMAQTYNNLGIVYAGQGEWQRALEMYEKSLEIMQRLGSLQGCAQVYGNLGLLYEQQRQLGRAKAYTQKALEIYERLGAPEAEKTRQTLQELEGEGES